MRAATYIRESTRAQEEGFSPDAQREALEQYAAQQGVEIVARYSDFESGTKETREGFQQMLEAAQAHDFDAILCFHTSRFARDAEVARRAKRQLRNLGVKVIALNLPNLDPESPEGHLLEGISEVLDEHYSRQLGWWTRAGLREKFRQGKFVGVPPLGYKRLPKKIVDDGGVERPHPQADRLVASEVAPIIREAYRKYATGQFSTTDLCVWMAEQGLRSTYGGGPLAASGVRKILTNRAYLGFIKHKTLGERLGDVEPLIDEGLFEEVQARLRERRAGSGTSKPKSFRSYALTGLLRCAACGTKWYGYTDSGGRSYYRCYGPGSRGCTGEIKFRRTDDLEGQIEEMVIRNLSLDAATKTAVVDALRGRQPDFEKERRKLERQLEREADLYRLGDTEREDYLQRRDSIKAQLAALPPVPLPLRQQQVLETLDGIADLWPEMAPAARKALCRSLLKEIVVQDGVITAIQPRPEAMAVVVSLLTPPRLRRRTGRPRAPARQRQRTPASTGRCYRRRRGRGG